MFGMTLGTVLTEMETEILGILMMIIKTITDTEILYGNVMSEREFSSFLQMLKKQNFDDRRLDFLKSQLNRTDFNTRQIKSIMKEFSFDKNRLEFAKWRIENV